jgi:CheY-like chemotaxis protein
LSVVSAGLELVQKDIKAIINQHELTELEAVIEMTQEISEATETAMNFVNDLLHYESMEAGQFAIDPSPTRPEDLVKPTTIQIVAKRSNLSLIVVPPNCVPEGCFVMADVHRMEQVVRNLVVNACKFTPTGGTIVVETLIICKENKEREVTLLLSPPLRSKYGGKVRIKVSDNGVGISKENQAKLFQQFVQFNKNELQGGGGSGLGLWIARTIVNLHSGELSFQSDGPGRGSSFFFDVPFFTSDSVGAAEVLRSPLSILIDGRVHPETTASPLSCSAEKRFLPIVLSPKSSGVDYINTTDVNTTDVLIAEKKFLVSSQIPIFFMIVDDLAMNRKILRRMLENEPSLQGSSIQEADDGSTALEALIARSCSNENRCIFMDSVMTIMHGPETVRNLRMNGFEGAIIGVTGNAMQQDIDSFMSSGLDWLVLKPLKRDVLMSSLAAVGLINQEET